MAMGGTELFKLFGTIGLDGIEKTNKEINDVTGKAESASGKIMGAFGKIGKTLAIGIGAGVTAASAAIVKIGKDAISAYADYEQLVGGVDTLFKDSSQKVQEYANRAYETAGLSANQYMETVTSFSASLIQSLGGNTTAAAELADQAIIDMSDNANKMGTDISMIQNAYQGFAKQNYTMLDNLKLGYGGTKEEMNRLLEDANRINEQQGIHTKYSIENFSDIVEAIHVVQNEMGITGTTAKEASTTITGSLNAMKGSWQNVLTAMTSDSGNLNKVLGEFSKTVETFAGNLMPRLKQVLQGIATMISQLAPTLVPMLIEMIMSLLPAIVDGATQLIQAVVGALPMVLQGLMAIAPALIEGFVNITNVLISALPQLMQMLVSALPTLLPLLINGLVSMILTLCNNLPKIIQPIIQYLPQIIVAIVEALTRNLPILIQGAIQLVLGIVQALPQILQSLISALPTVVSLIVETLLRETPKLIQGAIQIVAGIVKALPQILSALLKALPAQMKGIWDATKKVFADVKEFFGKKFGEARDKIVEIAENIKEKTLGKFRDLKTNVGETWENIKSAIVKPIETARDKVKNIIDRIKGFFNFKFKWPKIPLPHFGISPSGWKIGDLLKGSIPKLGIEWYAKGAILDKPSIFGVNGNNLMVGGEAGKEAVAPIDTLQTYVKDAVRSEMGLMESYLMRLVETVDEYLPKAAEDKNLVLDSGALVGAMAGNIDYTMGNINRRKERWG